MSEINTRLIHHPYQPPQEFSAPQAAIHKASTVFFSNVEALRKRDWRDKSGYTYGLHGTPSTFLLEERLCELEGGRHCLLVPSGLAAITNVMMALLKSGDQVLIPANVYGPAKLFADVDLKAWGIENQIYDPLCLDDLKNKVTEKTKVIWLEAPGSVTLEFPDLLRQLSFCRQSGLISVLDNTWGAGLAFNPFNVAETGLGVDVSVHALTKFPSGGGDVLMGSIQTCDPQLHSILLLSHMRLGLGVGGNDVEAVLRSLPSLALRYQAHDLAARSLVNWCANRAEIAQVLHPAHEASPGHAHWKLVCTSEKNHFGHAAGLFSVIFDAKFSQKQVDRFCDALKLFKLGYSWGGPFSLVMPYELLSIRSQWPQQISRGHLVRFSVGLEGVEDLRQDLEQALAKME